MPKLGHAIILALVSAWAVGVQADAFKCKTSDGKIVISDSPCQDGSKTVTVQAEERITPERQLKAEQEVERLRKLLTDQDKLRTAEEKREWDARQKLAEEESTRRNLCMQNAQREPDPQFRADLIAACNGVAPQRPVVVQQPLLIPAGPVRKNHRPGWACISGDCKTFEPPPRPPTGQGISGCRLVGSLMRCD